VHASTFYDAGHEVWPTATFTDDVADPRNEVHYDVIVAAGPDLVPVDELRSASKGVRQAARARLRPMFEGILGLMGEVQELEDPQNGLSMEEW
jgi:hypothetical protein